MRVDWGECTLSELMDVKHGFAFLGEYFAERGSHVVLTPGNFFERGGFRSKGEKEKWYTGPIPEDYVLRKGSVVVAMTEQAEGLLGASAIVPADDLYLHNQRLGLIRPRASADLGFLFHLFNSASVRQQIRGSATGTKVRHTSPSRIGAVRAKIPPLPIQRRIAGILSAYDDLIENCERRIRVLDGMARSLYREWFVQFRYPGHEKVPLVESSLGPIPKGWGTRRLVEIAAVNYGRNLPTKLLSADGAYPVYGAARMIGRHTEYTRSGRSLICGCRGSVGEMQITEPMCFVTNNSFTFDPGSPHDFFWLFHELQHRGLRDVVGGAAQPQITLDGISTVELRTPTDKLRSQFQSEVYGFHELMWNLNSRARNLRRTRDLLLPRLLSGQLSVEEVA